MSLFLNEPGCEVHKALSTLPERSRVMVVGEPDTGKSTFVALLARWFYTNSRKTAVVDCDVGQADVGPPGFISYGFVEHPVTSLKAVTRTGSYLVGNTSPYGRLLPVVTGTEACVRAAERDGADIILIDTSGLVRPHAGVQLKCAKAGAVYPHLVIALGTPGLRPLTDHLKSLGFRVLSLEPLAGVRMKSIEERRENRVFRWNMYLKDARAFRLDLSRVRIYRWWAETHYVDVDTVPHGTVVAVPDPSRIGLQTPCVWITSENGPMIIAPLPQGYEPEIVWVTSYRLRLLGTQVTSA